MYYNHAFTLSGFINCYKPETTAILFINTAKEELFIKCWRKKDVWIKKKLWIYFCNWLKDSKF